MNEYKARAHATLGEGVEEPEGHDGAENVLLMAAEGLGSEALPVEGRVDISLQEVAQNETAAENGSAENLRRELALRSAIRAVRKHERAQEMALRRAAQQSFIQEDIRDFLAKHPEVDLVKLDETPSFRRFCGSRYGAESLAKLYDDYCEIVGGAEKAAHAAAQSRSKRSTGSGGGGGDILTSAQRASLEAWNRENPDMKMTAREFLNH